MTVQVPANNLNIEYRTPNNEYRSNDNSSHVFSLFASIFNIPIEYRILDPVTLELFDIYVLQF